MNSRNAPIPCLLAFAAVALLVLAATPAQAKTLPVITAGAGDATCSQVVDAGATKPFAIQFGFLSWSQGYLSALGQAEAYTDSPSAESFYANFKKTSGVLLADSIARLCKNQPLVSLEGVTYQLYRQLGGGFLVKNK